MNLDISFLGQKICNFLKQKARGHEDSLHFVVYLLYQEITACAMWAYVVLQLSWSES